MKAAQGKKQRELQRFPLEYSVKCPSGRGCDETTEAGEQSPRRIQGSSTGAQKGLETEFLFPSNWQISHSSDAGYNTQEGGAPTVGPGGLHYTVLLHLTHLRSQI